MEACIEKNSVVYIGRQGNHNHIWEPAAFRIFFFNLDNGICPIKGLLTFHFYGELRSAAIIKWQKLVPPLF